MQGQGALKGKEISSAASLLGRGECSKEGSWLLLTATGSLTACVAELQRSLGCHYRPQPGTLQG